MKRSTPANVVVLDHLHLAESLADWGSLDAEVEFVNPSVELDSLTAQLSGHDVVVTMRERTSFTREVLERLPDLRLLVTTGRRNPSIDMKAAAELGIVVSGTPSLSHPPAELTIALVLTCARHLIPEILAMRDEGWNNSLGESLNGATIGLMGLGRIGSKVAQVARAFEMRVLAWSQNLTADMAEARGAVLVDKEELLRGSDYVSVHLRLSDRTRGLIGPSELGIMKTTSFLINTARGPIVDEQALLEAVRSGRIAGAALDVYDREPLPEDHPFRSEPRIITSPHLGYVTRDNYTTYYQGAVESILAWQNGDPIRTLD